MAIKLPQTPMLTGKNEPFYPLTHASQVIKTDGSRLEQNGEVVADKASTAEKLGGKAPEYYIQPRNLLDNSDFSVWQRGKASHTSTAFKEYWVDRWCSTAEETISPADEGVIITHSGPTDTQFRQYIKNWSALKGKTVTFCAMISGTEGESVRLNFCYNEDNSRYAEYVVAVLHSEPKLFTVSATIPSDIDSLCVLLGNWSSGDPLHIYWAALYEGEYTADTLPPYVPKGYAAELAECEAYYHRVFNADEIYQAAATAAALSETTAVAVVPLPFPMRQGTPSLVVADKTLLALQGPTIHNLTDIRLSNVTRGSAKLVCTVSGGLTAGQAYILTNLNNASDLAISSDI